MSQGENEPAASEQSGDRGTPAGLPRQEDPNPRPWAVHNLAGVEGLTRSNPYEFIIRFKEKPNEPKVLEPLKQAGFRWQPDKQWWARPIAYQTRMQDREIGQRTYNAVVKLLLAEKGLESPSPPPF